MRGSTKIALGFRNMVQWEGSKQRDHAIVIFISDGMDDDPEHKDLQRLERLKVSRLQLVV